MHNSYVEVLKGLYTGISADIGVFFPIDRKELEQDFSRLLSLIENRGLGFLTLDLPQWGKHFDGCLASGRLEPFGMVGSKPISGSSCVPRLFSTLMLRVFDSSGMLRDAPDINAIFFLRQLFYAAKKVRITCDESRTEESVRDFFRIESSMRHPSLSWDADDCDFSPSQRLHFADTGEGGKLDSGTRDGELFDFEEPAAPCPALLDTIQRSADLVSTSLGWFDPDEWSTRHGPGAVADQRTGVSKYLFPHWPAKLEAFFPMSRFGFANYGLWADVVSDDKHPLFQMAFKPNEPPAKLIAVPKTQKTPRLIASEPVSHQWCQQSLNEYLRDRIKQTPISKAVSFRDQTPNQEAALQASRTGSHWTIDLSSASDCMSLWVVERFFRTNKVLLNALHSTRSRWLVNEITNKLPKYLLLKKFAPMGAATTFPLQTIIYATVVVAVMLYHLNLDVSTSNMKKMAREVRVFGDDIVAPHVVGKTVVEVLTYLGFMVNPAKTYGTGRFRESCGVDAYDGIDVTPSYFLEPYDPSRPASVASMVEVSNNFHRKGLWNSAHLLKLTLPPWLQKKLAVVSTDSGAFGWTSFCGSDTSHLRKKWNPVLQRFECQAALVKTSVVRRPHLGESSLLQYFTEAPEPDVIWKSGVDSMPSVRIGTGWVPPERFTKSFEG